MWSHPVRVDLLSLTLESPFAIEGRGVWREVRRPGERSLAVHTGALSMALSEQFPVWGLILSPSVRTRKAWPVWGLILPGRLLLLTQLRNKEWSRTPRHLFTGGAKESCRPPSICWSAPSVPEWVTLWQGPLGYQALSIGGGPRS